MKLSDEAKPIVGIILEESKDLKEIPGNLAVKGPLKRKLSQKNSGIHEPENVENIDDHYILSVLDPTDNRMTVWAIRALLFWGVYFVCGFYITFGANSSYWAIGLGALAAYVLCMGVYLLEAYILVPWWYESFVGKPMVHWFSWGVFLDIMYVFGDFYEQHNFFTN
jgi:hypothetical protein